ncbi:MAG TPA: hypothetical protein VKW09_06200 [bacterium]|nr:hypothetical protein [bacterium]
MDPAAERFFRARALAGNLHLLDFNDWEEWNSAKVSYRDEAEAEWLTRMGGNAHRMIRTPAELDSVLRESVSARVFHLYIGERLLDEARRRWEDMKRQYKRS